MPFLKIETTDAVTADLMETINVFHEDYLKYQDLATPAKEPTYEDLDAWVSEHKPKVADAYTKAIAEARKALAPKELDVTEAAANKDQAKIWKKRLVSTLEALVGHTERKGLDTEMEAATMALSTIKKPSPAGRSTDLNEMRTWLKDKGYQVGDKGRIAKNLQDIYNAEH